MKLLSFVIPFALESCPEAWSLIRMGCYDDGSMAKIVAPVLLAGKSVRTPGLLSFRAPVMSPRGVILGFLTEPLV